MLIKTFGFLSLILSKSGYFHLGTNKKKKKDSCNGGEGPMLLFPWVPKLPSPTLTSGIVLDRWNWGFCRTLTASLCFAGAAGLSASASAVVASGGAAVGAAVGWLSSFFRKVKWLFFDRNVKEWMLCVNTCYQHLFWHQALSLLTFSLFECK